MSKKDVKKEVIDPKYNNIEFVHDSASKSLNYLTTMSLSTIGFILTITSIIIKSTPAKPYIGTSIVLMGLSLVLLLLAHLCLFFDLFNKKQSDIRWKLKLALSIFWCLYVFGIGFFLYSIGKAWQA